ncbi:MAG: hypothetical protein EOP32_04305 [Rhodococcus sp. (in: high G+C Gram-positive bacteria)]|nr:MAG: hypothetical protein EOP32_04305 [Rhodococcus sp. (in: high G+C Gram-positive bacteria)]
MNGRPASASVPVPQRDGEAGSYLDQILPQLPADLHPLRRRSLMYTPGNPKVGLDRGVRERFDAHRWLTDAAAGGVVRIRHR